MAPNDRALRRLFMFMFRSKRATLIRRLLKSRLIHESLGENEELLRTHVIARLHDIQLEALVTAIEQGNNAGSSNSSCVPVFSGTPSGSPQDIVATAVASTPENGGGSSGFCCCGSAPAASPPPTLLSGARETARRSALEQQPPPHFLCCQTYRWPELSSSSELKQLPQCTCDYNISDSALVCCNPYHWSRLCGPESPPPPYRRYPDEKLRPEDRAPSEGKLSSSSSTTTTASSGTSSGSSLLTRHQPGSLPTSGNGSRSRSDEWCKLAYWELQRRVGAQFPVSDSTVHVFSGPTSPGASQASLCLSDLSPTPQQAQYQPGEAATVRRTRDKIGLGVLLSQEADGVWAYNLSEAPLFVNSPTLDEPHSRALVVYKLPAGSCLRIFEWGRRRRPLDQSCGPVDPNSVRLSFAKGWGPKYSRQEVTACPCWLEVLLAPSPLSR